MQFDWQAVAAPALVLIAVVYLARKFLGRWILKPKPGASAGCGSCGSCPSSGDAKRSEPEVFQLAPSTGGHQAHPASPPATLPTLTKK